MVEEAAKHGRELALGEDLGVFRGLYIAESKEAARSLANNGFMGTGWPGWAHDFGFTDAFRLPEDDSKYPNQKLPRSEVYIERFEKTHFCLTGTATDIRREMDFAGRRRTRSGSFGKVIRVTYLWKMSKLCLRSLGNRCYPIIPSFGTHIRHAY